MNFAGGLVPLRPTLLAFHLCLELRTFSYSAFAGVVAWRAVDSHRLLLDWKPKGLGDFEAHRKEASIDDLVGEQTELAKSQLLASLGIGGSMRFSKVVDLILSAFMLRESNVKDIRRHASPALQVLVEALLFQRHAF